MTADWLMYALLGAASLLGGAIASVTGFGIGSLLTPALGLKTGTKLAVAAIAIPHFIGSAQRFWMLRSHVDRRILWSFGLTSAAGGLAGALLHSFAGGPILRLVFGGLLVFAGLTGVTGLAERIKFRGWLAWIAGALSGLLGGLVGNQGGIRSAAMLGFEVPKHAFVATATAIALFVDAARVPVYLYSQWREITAVWPFLVATSIGVIAGTLVGKSVLQRIPESIFRRAVSSIVLILGISMFLHQER